MKAILISIQPKWVEKILSGKKTIEIRKTAPKCDLPIDVYIYATKYKHDWVIKDGVKEYMDWVKINGKVVAKFTLNKVSPTGNLTAEEFEQICISKDEFIHYVGKAKVEQIYAWHISDLQVFDKPRELKDFKKWFEHIQKNLEKGIGCRHSGECDAELNWHCAVDCYGYSHDEVEIKRPPQSYQFVEVAG